MASECLQRIQVGGQVVAGMVGKTANTLLLPRLRAGVLVTHGLQQQNRL